jgi:hypothetical protein
LIMAEQPNMEFGRRKSAAIQTAAPVKRSSHVALLLMGTFAIGGGAYGFMPRENCETRPGMAAPSGFQTSTECQPRGSSSSGGRGWWAGRCAATSSAAIPRQAARRPALRPIPVRAASRAAVSARLRARSRRIFPVAVDQPAVCRTVKQLAFACFVASGRLDLNFDSAVGQW